MPARKMTRSVYDRTRDVARDIATTNAHLVSHRLRRGREMLFAHLMQMLKLDRLRRGPNGPKDEFLLAPQPPRLTR